MKTVLAVIAISVCWSLTWWFGYSQGKQSVETAAVIAEGARLAQAFEQGQALGTVRDRIVTEYVDRVEYIEKRGATIIKEVPVYVSAKADAACTVNSGFVRLHDAAATGADLSPSGGSGAADEAPSGVALSTVAATTAANYAACNANAEQLSKLQGYARAFQGMQSEQVPP
ncbi:hypothetical protein ALQ33_200025 [Pseudomonas syringae pv. philadelphi]|uniref:Uncharacterized protein n=1 Tax=Pseudomonas syringae pv. philadelphi TaxID=251706 RepID=A0A3M3YDZ8_9PSED|nr:hypothetical protein [Pseudomonas syringae group genomosp. 3]RMO79803.1 hypothetical protein ALQ33_200025 [Pseudomonas syringae pv. philadelphi]